jgi:serine/threonine-protein kinase
LKKIAISGGVVQSLCDAPAGRGGAWGPDGAIVFAPTNSSGLFRVSSSGSAPAPLTRIAAAGEFDRYPWFIPGTDRFLYLHDTANPQTAGLYMSSLGGMSPLRVLPDLTQAYFVPDAAVGRGWIVFNREGSVVAQPFDPDHARVSGDPVLLAGSTGPGGNTNKWSFSASATGTLAVHPASGDREQIAWVDRTGRVLSRITAPARIQSFALSPDEKRLLLRIGHGGGDLWLQDLDGGNLTRFTSSGMVNTTQVWSPDGRYVLYAERPNSLESHLYRKPTDGSTKEELLADLSHETSADDWSRDGKYLLIRNSQATAPKMLLFPADSAGRPLSPLPGKSISGYGGRISPDSRWLAVTTEEGVGRRVSVQAFPNGGPAWQVYSKQADEPHWRRDGKELYIIGSDRKVIAIPVETNGNVFRAGTPQPLFEIPSRDAFLVRLQPSNDGQRFLVRVLPEGEPAVPPLEFVLNWPATVQRSEIAR